MGRINFGAKISKSKEEMDRLGIQQFWIYYSGLLLNAVNPLENTLERATYISKWFQTEYAPKVQLEASCLKTLFYLKEKG